MGNFEQNREKIYKKYRPDLIEFLDSWFDIDALETIFFKLGFDIEEVEQKSGKERKIVAIIERCWKELRLSDLLDKIFKLKTEQFERNEKLLNFIRELESQKLTNLKETQDEPDLSRNIDNLEELAKRYARRVPYIPGKQNDFEEIAQRIEELRTDKESNLSITIRELDDGLKKAIERWEFVNRLKELKGLLEPDKSTFITLVTAPAGFGKSYLLWRIKADYESRHPVEFVCLLTNFSKWPTSIIKSDEDKIFSMVLNDALSSIAPGTKWKDLDNSKKFEHLANYLKSMQIEQGLVWLFDAVNCIDDYKNLGSRLERMGNWLMENLFEKHLKEHQLMLRIIIAGRNLTPPKSGGYWSDPISLEPLGPDIIQDFLIRRYTGEEYVVLKDESVVEHIAHEVWQITGGHPLSITEVLKYLFTKVFNKKNNEEKNRVKEYFSFDNKRQLFNRHINNIVSDMIKDLNSEMQAILESLSVFRIFYVNTIDELNENGLLKIQQTSENKKSRRKRTGRKIRKQLLDTGLVILDKEIDAYRDRILRYLLWSRLRFNYPKEFKSLNDFALEFYDKKIQKRCKTLLYSLEEKDEEEDEEGEGEEERKVRKIIQWMIESIYHSLVKLELDNERQPQNSIALNEWIKELKLPYIKKLDELSEKGEFDDLVSGFENKLQEDTEINELIKSFKYSFEPSAT